MIAFLNKNKGYTATPGEGESVIGEGSYFHGTIDSVSDLRIDGIYQGSNIKANVLTVGKTGMVKTNAYVGSLVLEGVLVGDVIASIRVLLMPGSKLVGNLSTPELITSRGVLFEGACRVSSELNTDISKSVKNMFKDIPEDMK